MGRRRPPCSPVVSSVNIATGVASEPVPAVVGMHTSGRGRRTTLPMPASERASRPSSRVAATNFAVSMTLPPPRATTASASKPARRADSTAAATQAKGGSGSVRSKTWNCIPALTSGSDTRASTPAAFTPPSVMIRGFSRPRRRNSLESSALMPRPKRRRRGRLFSNALGAGLVFELRIRRRRSGRPAHPARPGHSGAGLDHHRRPAQVVFRGGGVGMGAQVVLEHDLVDKADVAGPVRPRAAGRRGQAGRQNWGAGRRGPRK